MVPAACNAASAAIALSSTSCDAGRRSWDRDRGRLVFGAIVRWRLSGREGEGRDFTAKSGDLVTSGGEGDGLVDEGKGGREHVAINRSRALIPPCQASGG